MLPYPAASWPSGPKATLVTEPSLTSSGVGRSRSPRALKSTTPPPRPLTRLKPYPAASWPSGPKATLLTMLSLTASGVGRSRSPRASKSTTPPTETSHGDPALRPEGHARDRALLDLQRLGSEPLAPGVEEHHAADAVGVEAVISRGELALRPEGHALDPALLDHLQRRGSEPLAPGVEEHHAAATVAAAISRGELALRPEGHAY